MKKAGKRSGKIKVKKLFSGVTALVISLLILVGTITVIQKGKNVINSQRSIFTAVSNSVKGLGRLFTGGVLGVYKCQGNVNLIEQFEFKIDGTGYARNIMKQENVFSYDVDGKRLVISWGSGQTEVFKIDNGQIVLPLEARCVK